MIPQAQSYQDNGSASFEPPTLNTPGPNPWLQPQPDLSLDSEPTPRSGIEGMIHSSSDPTLGEAPGCYADGSDFINPFVLSTVI
jgi:hypothetical protein